jgi:hypothetical protein
MNDHNSNKALVDFVRMAENYGNLAAASVVRDSGFVGREAADLMDIASQVYKYSIIFGSGLDDAGIDEALRIMGRTYEDRINIPIRDGNEKHDMPVHYPCSVISESGRLSAVI